MSNIRNKHIAEWVAALRSGNYVQGQDYLCKEWQGDKTFCCLGVACDLLVKQHPDAWRWTMPEIEPGSLRVHEIQPPHDVARVGGLPQSAAEWLVGDEESPYIGDYGVLPFRDRSDQQLDLVLLNDQCKLNFLQIADVINYAWGALRCDAEELLTDYYEGERDGDVEA